MKCDEQADLQVRLKRMTESPITPIIVKVPTDKKSKLSLSLGDPQIVAKQSDTKSNQTFTENIESRSAHAYVIPQSTTEDVSRTNATVQLLRKHVVADSSKYEQNA